MSRDTIQNRASGSGGLGTHPLPTTFATATLEAYVKASNTGANDGFGDSVAIDGDTVVAGAPFEASSATGINGDQSNNSATESGAVYVFIRTNGVWSQQAYIKASNPEELDQFGFSVAISGDTLVVGAPGENSSATGINGNQADNSANGSGAAYVFTRTNGVWSQQAYLKASNTGEGDKFGRSVAISGNTVVVGAPWEESNATGVNGNQADNSKQASGAAYVFTRSNGVWNQRAYLKASNTGVIDEFGRSVAVSGNTAVVGAPGEDSSATGINGNQADNSANGSGAAYVFTRTNGVWSQQAYLKASNTGANDEFGGSVAISGNVVVMGAWGEDSSATGINGNQADNSAASSGGVYVFTRPIGPTSQHDKFNMWKQQAYVKPSNTGGSDFFGHSVALDGDTLVVGAHGEDSSAMGINGNQFNNSATASGAVYVYRAK